MGPPIIESGHFYVDMGFTEVSQQGWEIGQRTAQEEGSDELWLFIDDVHAKTDLSQLEQDSVVIPVYIKTDGVTHLTSKSALELVGQINGEHTKTPFILEPNHIILESELESHARVIAEKLKRHLPKKKKAKLGKDGSLHCSGKCIITERNIVTCALFDAALSEIKSQFSNTAINILPNSYQDQQQLTHRLVAKLIPEFEIQTIYY